MGEENAADMLGSDQGQGGSWMLLDCWTSHVVFTNLYWQGLLPHYSTSDSKHFLCLILLLCACTRTHTQCLFFHEKEYQWHTQETFWLSAALALLFSDLVFICLGKTNSYNSFTTLWHVTRAVLIPPLPFIQHLHFLWDITSFFFLPYAFQT